MDNEIERELFNEAVQYFGDKEAALLWFNTPNITLGGHKPGEYCKKEFGYLKVRDLVNRMKHGITA
ncbi:MbcA/ParS/Xre antitoxin family protein [Neptunomonas qingdaonensis]|uniref:Antitoxin Xre/MbcA/ParS-like toxin-binding domain-containing protein n=1 Tax=Neptunomonas qingdaonensis TaxID=1045558 RepID=A0A1I2QX02_9GAMM|nr:MbcA/ParS/Xre antitoxin family protein [Neptunomonas qingdaonensis]SFG30226.1 Protein of unknown function [Neptunomonas qingdaonensis]